jgi:hypothetical protein
VARQSWDGAGAGAAAAIDAERANTTIIDPKRLFIR